MKPARLIATIAISSLLVGAATATADSVISGDTIVDGTITTADLAPDVVADLDSSPSYRRRVVTISYDNETTVTIACANGEHAVNGGIRWTSDSDASDHSTGLQVLASYPARSGWTLIVDNASIGGEDENTDPAPITAAAFAVCE